MCADSLDSSVRFLKGVGPRRAEQFGQLGITTVGDLLNHFPRRHQYFGDVQAIADLREGQTAAVIGTIVAAEYRRWGKVPSLLAGVEDQTGRCSVRWFHGGYLREKIVPGRTVWLFGKVGWYRGLPQLVNPKLRLVEDDQPVKTEEMEATYPATAELPSNRIARIVKDNLPHVLPLIPECVDADLLAERALPGRCEAYQAMHLPPNEEAWQRARRRLAYDELLMLELAMGIRRRWWREHSPAYGLRCDARIDRHIRQRLPFELTAAQNRVIGEIVADLGRRQPMNRLLQGDVGSGKTVVALYAALVAVANRCQAALMAPTEIVAEQHFGNIEKYLAGSQVRRALLVGGMNRRRREQHYRHIADGRIDLVVGTQALLQEHVTFPRLAAVIVDEQHKFGVLQRATIRSKGLCPHYLVMTATPIPRSLALTAFGDLDVSILGELPPGRRPISTRLVAPESAEVAYAEIRSHLDRGQQAFVVYPLVEEAPDSELKAATAEARRLASTTLRGYRVGLIHGRMSTAEKDAVMGDFRSGGIQVLVATIVIEVGVDVPNATVMAVQHADRFGLAQLHQLRGRIGRGDKPAVCLLFSDARSPIARERLKALCQTTDGFRLAAEDLRLRGPGQFFGTRQHGLPELKVASLVDDAELLEMAHKDAQRILAHDALFAQGRYGPLLEELRRQWAGRLALIDAG